MNISFNWLKQYIKLPDSVHAKDVAEKLKLTTVEVEGIIYQDEFLENVVVGKVVSADKHPKADKLKLCQVDVGNEKIQIVCGGSNVISGMFVALAKVGASVKWHGKDEVMKLEPIKIRGEESFGMICSATEIGLEELFPTEGEQEIIDLSLIVNKKDIGNPLSEVLNFNDAIFEIDNKSLSNRPDLWGHFGIAREVAVLFGKDLKKYETKKIKKIKNIEIDLSVDVADKKLCPAYSAVAISGIKIKESPDWLKRRLASIGVNSVNNIVDITNYILFDLGQPMHAFDVRQLHTINKNTKKIVVRVAQQGEILKLLDDNKIKLSEKDLVIADIKNPIALAGIMGGKSSSIVDDSNIIIFESANFNASTIRQSSSNFGIRTDSSARFEKSLDPSLVKIAMEKAIELTLSICEDAYASSLISDVSNFSIASGPIIIDKNIFTKKLGINIPEKEIVKILSKLGFSLKDSGKTWSVTIPSWRATKDISIAEDLVEEVIRIWGYDNIKSELPKFVITPPSIDAVRQLSVELQDILTGQMSADEVINYSFVSRDQIKKLLEDNPEYIELDNPLSKEKPFLRRSLLPNLLENIVKNSEYFNVVKIFEIGTIFLKEEPGVRVAINSDRLLPKQDTILSLAYSAKKDENPIMFIRRAVEQIAEKKNFNFEVKADENVSEYKHPGRAGIILVDKVEIGSIYEVHPIVAKKYGLENKVAILELNLNIFSDINCSVKYTKPSIYPEIERDLSFVIDKKYLHFDIHKALVNIDSLIKTVKLFDIYDGKNIETGKKSVAYHFVISDYKKTLSSDEADDIINRAIEVIEKKFDAKVRA